MSSITLTRFSIPVSSIISLCKASSRLSPSSTPPVTGCQNPFLSGNLFSSRYSILPLFIRQIMASTCTCTRPRQEQEEKKRKKKKQLSSLKTERAESELFPELMKGLEELEKEKKYVDIQVCPKCKSPLVRRAGSMTGDMSAHMGFTPPKYECRECGWREKTVLKAP